MSREESTVDPEAMRSSRMKLLIIISIAFVPLFMAYVGYFFLPEWAPEGTTNQGELVMPPVDGGEISVDLAAERRWTLILPVQDGCESDCEQLLYLSRQVIAGLGKDTDRVGRVILSAEPPEGLLALIEAEHGDARLVYAPTTALTALQAAPALFLMDPNGNIMMYYTLEKAGKPMMKDLKHLLRISNIG